jgi:membrane associated rhomboid family serine protease
LKSASEPVFNVPAVVSATLAAMCMIHAIRELALSPRADLEVLIWFAFIPARYDPAPLAFESYPGGLAADVWTFVTYALLHGNLLHLALNSVWLLAFGAPLARRFGPGRFLSFFAVTAAAGAVAHLMTHPGDRAPMIGASAAISGFMAAAVRFVFQPGGSLAHWRYHRATAHAVPAAPLSVTLRDPRILAFLTVWFGLNLLFGLVSFPALDGGQPVAWQAHVGGFLAGLFAFAAFDPIGPARTEGGEATPSPEAEPGSRQN